MEKNHFWADLIFALFLVVCSSVAGYLLGCGDFTGSVDKQLNDYRDRNTELEQANRSLEANLSRVRETVDSISIQGKSIEEQIRTVIATLKKIQGLLGYGQHYMGCGSPRWNPGRPDWRLDY